MTRRPGHPGMGVAQLLGVVLAAGSAPESGGNGHPEGPAAYAREPLRYGKRPDSLDDSKASAPPKESP